MRLGLSGHGGVVDIDHCARIGYLRDASEHCLPGSNFEVPFSIDSLSIVAEFCREASSPLSESEVSMTHFHGTRRASDYECTYKASRANAHATPHRRDEHLMAARLQSSHHTFRIS